MFGEVLTYLSADDLRLLDERTSELTYRTDEVIVQEGKAVPGLFLIASGSVRVEKASLTEGMPIAQLDAGEILGEMSFLEEENASASILANEEVTVRVITRDHLHSLLYSVPGFSSRFYHSLAVIVSARLRATSSMFVRPFSWG